METSGNGKTVLAIAAFSIFAIITFGLIWFFFLGPDTPVGFGWYLFSFAAGLSMIVLPCTLPLAFVIVPLSMGKGAIKGIGIALSFGIGVALTLSMYGIIAAVVGEVAIGTIGAPLETVKNWLYLVAGIFAYIFALGELGLIRFRMPSYTGAAPAFIQKQQDYLKALLLGLFLGNIGVGCPHPATPVILTRIAASGDVFYGWLLFFTHAVGRVLPLLLLAFLGIMGVNALSWLVARKEKIERRTGWVMVFVAAFILVLGLFTHDWWGLSGQHTLFEELTGEEHFLGIIISRFHFAGAPHSHGLPTGTGLFGLPLALGNWALVLLWIIPIWWMVIKKNKETAKTAIGTPTEIKHELISYRVKNAVTTTVLLALVFVWYLPTRFLNNLGTGMAIHPNISQAHEATNIREGISVDLNITPPNPITNASTRLDFFVNKKPQRTPIPATDLELEHEKIMHVIGVRDDLNEFFHIHPAPVEHLDGLLSVVHEFKKPGNYKIWSEIKYQGMMHSFGEPQFSVEGEGIRSEKIVSFERLKKVDGFEVSFDQDTPIQKGVETMLAFDLHDGSGQTLKVEPYLGADMHLTIIKDDLTQFIQTHPEANGMHSSFSFPALLSAILAHRDEAGPSMQASNNNHIFFPVIFPETGLYKVFTQFRPAGSMLPPDEALLASFWIRVEEPQNFAFSGWWTKLFVSIILIVLLSLGVKKYIDGAKMI